MEVGREGGRRKQGGLWHDSTMSESYKSVEGKTPHQKSDRRKEWGISWGKLTQRDEVARQTNCFQLTKPQLLKGNRDTSNPALVPTWKIVKLKVKAYFLSAS